MNKIKKLIIFLLLFGLIHCYTEYKFNNDPPKGVLERIEDWIGGVGIERGVMLGNGEVWFEFINNNELQIYAINN